MEAIQLFPTQTVKPESKDKQMPGKTIRFTFGENDDIERAMERDKKDSYGPYVRSFTRLCPYYTDSEVEDLIKNRAFYHFAMKHKKPLAQLANAILKDS